MGFRTAVGQAFPFRQGNPVENAPALVRIAIEGLLHRRNPARVL